MSSLMVRLNWVRWVKRLLYNEMIEAGINPDDVTHRALLWGYCRINLFKEAMDVLGEMNRRNHRVGNIAYRFLIHGLCKNEKVSSAIQVLEKMISSQCKPDETTYSAIIDGVAAAGMEKKPMNCVKTDRMGRSFSRGSVNWDCIVT